ncbi:MAG: glutathione S-transferase family protein [Pseudomonadota bacterium]
MKLLSSLGPNPRGIRMYMLEKDISLPTEEIDILNGANRSGDYAEKNPGAQMPSLQLDDGTVIAETVPVYEYLEEKFPNPPLIGSNSEERAEARMWQRRIELKITEHIYCAFRYGPGLEMYQARQTCFPDMLDGLQGQIKIGIEWLDGLMAEREYLCGHRFTFADIILYSALDFAHGVGLGPSDSVMNINRWFESIASRPTAKASLHEAGTAQGFRGV